MKEQLTTTQKQNKKFKKYDNQPLSPNLSVCIYQVRIQWRFTTGQQVLDLKFLFQINKNL